jgi:hypothetical protein
VQIDGKSLGTYKKIFRMQCIVHTENFEYKEIIKKLDVFKVVEYNSNSESELLRALQTGIISTDSLFYSILCHGNNTDVKHEVEIFIDNGKKTKHGYLIDTSYASEDLEEFFYRRLLKIKEDK